VGLHSADTRYAAGKKALAIPFEIENGVVYLGVSVNGAPPLSFILDTGSSYTVLDVLHAKSLRLELQTMGKMEGGSGGARPDYYLIPGNVSFGLPGVVFSSDNAIAISFHALQACFDRVADRKSEGDIPAVRDAPEGPKRMLGGILGKDFFESHVVEIDYATRRINLYDPHSYDYQGKGRTLQLEIGGYIFVQTQIKATARQAVGARLMIDTGASAPLTLTKEFIAANHLQSSAGKLDEVNDCGIGGPAKGKSWVGRMQAIQLGGLKVRNPLTVFLQNPEVLDYDGVLGGTSLWNFKVIFDYSRHRMILEPLRR